MGLEARHEDRRARRPDDVEDPAEAFDDALDRRLIFFVDSHHMVGRFARHRQVLRGTNHPSWGANEHVACKNRLDGWSGWPRARSPIGVRTPRG